ncbi:hypothetical protein [Thermithiobacillus plumbiphilus]|uniref:Uncharacterized protein n=1 Tax=Thermithiobacillus plumbiphilus TaxID=1729899 RepID=A0ABU9D992_9PROT
MRVLLWIGIFLVALGLLAWLVFKITIRLAMLLFLAGVAFIVWGGFKLSRMGRET